LFASEKFKTGLFKIRFELLPPTKLPLGFHRQTATSTPKSAASETEHAREPADISLLILKSMLIRLLGNFQFSERA
jgi:hypothetical protein